MSKPKTRQVNKMLSRTILVAALTASFGVNAENVNSLEPDLSTSAKWNVFANDPNQFDPSAPNVGAKVVPKPRGWMGNLPRAKWISSSEQAANGSAPVPGLSTYEMYTEQELPNGGTYCFSGAYLADDYVKSVEIYPSHFIDSGGIPTPCANGNCNTQASVATSFEFQMTFPPTSINTFYVKFDVMNRGGPTAFTASLFVNPGPCRQSAYGGSPASVEEPVPVNLNNGQWPMAVAGDWDCDGRDGVGIYQRWPGKFLLWNNTDFSGPPDFNFFFGPKRARWQPVVGDWNGNGCDSIGVYNPWQQVFHLKYYNTNGPSDERFGW